MTDVREEHDRLRREDREATLKLIVKIIESSNRVIKIKSSDALWNVLISICHYFIGAYLSKDELKGYFKALYEDRRKVICRYTDSLYNDVKGILATSLAVMCEFIKK